MSLFFQDLGGTSLRLCEGRGEREDHAAKASMSRSGTLRFKRD